jgi:hypothetical protein
MIECLKKGLNKTIILQLLQERRLVPAGEQEFRKFDFNETIDRPPFTAMAPEYEKDNKGKYVKVRQGK